MIGMSGRDDSQHIHSQHVHGQQSSSPVSSRCGLRWMLPASTCSIPLISRHTSAAELQHVNDSSLQGNIHVEPKDFGLYTYIIYNSNLVNDSSLSIQHTLYMYREVCLVYWIVQGLGRHTARLRCLQRLLSHSHEL